MSRYDELESRCNQYLRPHGPGNYPRVVRDAEYHGAIPPEQSASPPALKDLNTADGEEKTRWELLPFSALNEVAKVLTAGAQKYADNSWQGVDSHHYLGALLRHLAAWRRGEAYDKDLDDRGCRVSHLACVATNALFLLWQELHRKDKE